jgi:hypothetical protein
VLRKASLLIAIAVALLAGSTAAAMASPTARLGLSMQMYSGRISSAAQAESLAKAYSLISLRSEQLGQWGPAMHAANPSLRLYVYLNGMYAQSPEGSRFPLAWYMKDRHGHRIRSRGYGNWLMDPRGRAAHSEFGVTAGSWGDWVAQRCKLLVAGGQFNGCFLDMLGSAPLWSGYNSGGAVPARGSRGVPFTAVIWFKAISGRVAERVSEVAGVPVYGNGIGSGARYYGGELGPSRILLGYAARGDAETWMRTPGQSITDLPGGAAWRTEVQMLADSSAAGRPVNATVKTWVNASEAYKARWRRYTYTSFLLGNRGGATFEFSPAEAMPTDEANSLIYSIQLGAPVVTRSNVLDYYGSDGVYRRVFENGIVLVNAGSKTRLVRFAHPLYSPGGVAYTSLRIAPRDGAILLRTP